MKNEIIYVHATTPLDINSEYLNNLLFFCKRFKLI